MVSPKNLIITGTPGIGKTTLIKECTYPFRDHLGGFVTEEIREGTIRQGFLLRTFEGETGILAKKGMASQMRLNKYGVDLSILESVGLFALERAKEKKKILIVDEIGTMEMLSSPFCAFVTRALAGPQPFLATIRKKAEPFTSQIKKMSDTSLLMLTRENYPKLKNEIRIWIEEQLKK